MEGGREESREPRRLRALWRLIFQFLLFIVVYLISALSLEAAWSEIVSTSPTGPGGVSESGGPSHVALTSLIDSVSSLIAAFVSLWVSGRFLDRRRFRDFGFHLSRGWWLGLGFGLALGGVLMAAIFLIELAFGWVSIDGAVESTIRGTPFWIAIALPVVVFLCVGINEEMTARGYQLQNIAEGLNFSAIGPRGAVLLALVLSSSVFGTEHAFNPDTSIISTFGLVFLGVMFATGYVLTGQLAIPIGLHVSWNFFQGNVFGFPVSGTRPVGASFLSVDQGGPELVTGGDFGPEAGLLGIGVMILGCALIYLWVRLRQGEANVLSAIAERPDFTKINQDP